MDLVDKDVLIEQWPGLASILRVQQLIDASKQPHIVASTPKDALTRFTSPDAIDSRVAAGHLILALVDIYTDELAGLAWFHQTEESVHGAKITYAHRLYQNHIGRGISIPFAEATHQIAALTYGQQAVWLQTRVDNVPAIRTYETVGYRTVEQNDGILTMVTQLHYDGDL